MGVLSWRGRGLRYAAAACVFLVAGCAGTESPAPAPLEVTGASPSSSSSPSASPSAAQSLPVEARGTSKKAAVAFVRHYIDVLNYSARSLDTTLLEELSAKDCAACRSVIDHLEDMEERRGVVQGGAWSEVESLVLASSSEERWQVQVLVKYGAQKVTWPHGREPDRYESGRSIFLFDARPTNEVLRISAIRKMS